MCSSDLVELQQAAAERDKPDGRGQGDGREGGVEDGGVRRHVDGADPLAEGPAGIEVAEGARLEDALPPHDAEGRHGGRASREAREGGARVREVELSHAHVVLVDVDGLASSLQ